jgi:hypothetical protein
MTRGPSKKKPKFKELDAVIMAAKLIGYKARRKQINRKRGSALNMINSPDRCLLCEETRCLERAHIIPVAIYENIKIDEPMQDIYHDAAWMCPTHHKCYDKQKLTEDEHLYMLGLIHSFDYYNAFVDVLNRLETLTPGSMRAIKSADQITKSAWVFWRSYANN